MFCAPTELASFCTSGPKSTEKQNLPRNLLDIPESMRATANVIRPEAVMVHGKTIQEPQLCVSQASPQNSRPSGGFKIRTYLACSFARNPATFESLSVKLFLKLTTAHLHKLIERTQPFQGIRCFSISHVHSPTRAKPSQTLAPLIRHGCCKMPF